MEVQCWRLGVTSVTNDGSICRRNRLKLRLRLEVRCGELQGQDWMLMAAVEGAKNCHLFVAN